VLKIVIFLLQVGYTGDFGSNCPFKLCLSVQVLTPLFFLTVPNLVIDKRFNGDSKNVLKTVIFLLQVGFTGDFVSDCAFILCFFQLKL